MGESLPKLVRELLDAPTFVVVTTLNPDGGPQSSVVWVMRDGDEVVFSTVRGRRKARNMMRDPRVTICGFDPTNPYRYFEVRGLVSLSEEGGRALIDQLSNKYQGTDYQYDPPDAVRLICRVTATKVLAQGE